MRFNFDLFFISTFTLLESDAMSFLKKVAVGCACLLLTSALYAAGVYEGERNAFNRFHGKGTYKYTNGNVYEGEWVDGRKNGEGTQTWANGEKYSGGWSNNREHGKGKKTWPNGNAYSGEWLQGKMSGKGTFKWANGDTYTGNFIADQRQGKGVFVEAATKAKYEGSWKDDKKDGSFTVTLKNGTVAKGVWRGDKAPAKASVVLAGGELYSGPVNKGFIPSGKGTCTNAGKATPCTFVAGKKQVVVAKPEPKPVPKPAPKPKATPKPVAKPFQPAVGAAGAVAAAGTATAVAAPEVAAKPVEPPKPKNPRTMRGVRADGSQFFFKHSWGGVSDNLQNLKVEKGINDFGAMRLTAKGGDFDVVITIDEYVGPGTYELKYFKASISKTGESTTYRTSSSDPGTIKILKDGDGMLIGLFSFNGYPNGNAGADKKSITEGEFAIPLK